MYYVQKINNKLHTIENLEFSTEAEALEWLHNDYLYYMFEEVNSCTFEKYQALVELPCGNDSYTITWYLFENDTAIYDAMHGVSKD